MCFVDQLVGVTVALRNVNGEVMETERNRTLIHRQWLEIMAVMTCLERDEKERRDQGIRRAGLVEVRKHSEQKGLSSL